MTITECVAVSYNQKIINEPLDKVKSNEVNPRGVNCRVERNLTEQEMLKDIVAESKNKWILQEIIRDVKVSWLKQIKLMKPDRKEMIPHEECVGIKYNKPVKVREEIRHTIENNNSKKEDELTNERRYSHGNHIENELEEHHVKRIELFEIRNDEERNVSSKKCVVWLKGVEAEEAETKTRTKAGNCEPNNLQKSGKQKQTAQRNMCAGLS